MPIHAQFVGGDLDPQSRLDWPSFWCTVRVH